MFRYCPACASEEIRFEQDKVFRCPACGLTYYHNTAAATACIVRTNAGLLFIVRNKDPGKGMLDLPGGFVDPGEGAVEGLRREFIEELGIDPLLDLVSMPVKLSSPAIPGGDIHGKEGSYFRFLASFSNKYLYKNISYNTCDLFFYMDAPDLTEKDLHLQTSEISGLRFIKPEELDMDKIAFDSVKKALRVYLGTNKCVRQRMNE